MPEIYLTDGISLHKTGINPNANHFPLAFEYGAPSQTSKSYSYSGCFNNKFSREKVDEFC